MRRIPLVLLFCVLIGLLYVMATRTSPQVGSGQSAPSGELANLGPAPPVAIKGAGGAIDLDKFKGQVVLVDFWATWCGPCRQATPDIVRLYDANKAQGLQVIGVAMETDNGAALPAVVQEERITYPVGLPTNMNAAQQFAPALPTMVLIDRRGNMRWKAVGYGEGSQEAMQAAVKSALAERG